MPAPARTLSPAPPLAARSAPPLQAAVAAATALIRAGAAPPPTSFPTDGAGIPGGPPALADAITADFGRAYFVGGDLDGRAYAPRVVFVDPTITVAGLAQWRANIAALKPYLVNPTIELEGGRVEVVAGGGGDGGASPTQPTLRAAWRLRSGIALPWRPAVDVRGETVYETAWVGGAGERLVVVRHTEAWRTPAWAAVGQLLRPGGR